MNIPMIREYNITFHLPVYRQNRLDLNEFVASEVIRKGGKGKNLVVNTCEEYFNPEEVAKKRTYRDNGVCYFPTRQFKAALKEAAKRFKDPQSTRASAALRITAGVKMATEKVPISQEPAIAAELVRIPPGPRGVPAPCAWPEFRNLTITIPVQILDEFISLEMLRNVSQLAITMYGFGTGRPDIGTGTLEQIDLVK